jgi:hypothetical protein
MSTWAPPHVGPNWGNPLLVSPIRACRFHPTLILSTSMSMFLGEFTLLAICSHIFQIPTFWGQLLLESWKLVCVILFIWFLIWHKRNPRWGVHPKSKHTHFLCLNFHFFLSPFLWPSLPLRVHFGSNTPRPPCQAKVIYASTNSAKLSFMAQVHFSHVGHELWIHAL